MIISGKNSYVTVNWRLDIKADMAAADELGEYDLAINRRAVVNLSNSHG